MTQAKLNRNDEGLDFKARQHGPSYDLTFYAPAGHEDYIGRVDYRDKPIRKRPRLFVADQFRPFNRYDVVDEDAEVDTPRGQSFERLDERDRPSETGEEHVVAGPEFLDALIRSGTVRYAASPLRQGQQFICTCRPKRPAAKDARVQMDLGCRFSREKQFGRDTPDAGQLSMRSEPIN